MLGSVHKLGIAQKEANETIYWLKVISRCGYIDDNVYRELMYDVEELMSIITASFKFRTKQRKFAFFQSKTCICLQKVVSLQRI